MAPSVFTIPAYRPFADALAAGLLARFGGTPTHLAHGVLLVPNGRAARALQDAFVRRAGGGLLLPRLVPIGDPELGERIGPALEDLAEEQPIPPAVEPIERLMMLARLVQRYLPLSAPEALHRAEELVGTLDQLLIEEVAPHLLANFAEESPELAEHWQASFGQLRLLLEDWPPLLEASGRIDLAERRRRQLDAAAQRWRQRPPAGFVCAAGITSPAPAIARLLRTVAELPHGLVVLPALDLALPEPEWAAIGERRGEGDMRWAHETHPQFQLRLLLDRMGIGRGEVRHWRHRGGRDSPPSRARAVAHALAPAPFTSHWQKLPPRERRLSRVRALELTDPAEEAQAIALALREALEQPGRTAALVTPDRTLARRVAAHLRRWGIEADDSAGTPLSQTPPGTLLLALAAAVAERFAPVALLTLLKHPLVRAGDPRLVWLDGARQLDLALRGPRPAAGLDGIEALLDKEASRARDREIRAAARTWWRQASPMLRPLEQAFAGSTSLAERVAALRTTAQALCGTDLWTASAGRAAAETLAALEAASGSGPEAVLSADLPLLLERILAGVPVRPPYGQHPRIFIWGVLEARLQSTELVILGGLNEGTWPMIPPPDPWLAPRLRAKLGLPSLERRIGLAAHDLAGMLGGAQVLLTRARRDSRAPTIASRFWLRLEALSGGMTRAPLLQRWAHWLDRPLEHRPGGRPAPAPSERPRDIWVTEVDRLKADPFAFYASRVLRLKRLDEVDADPSAAWRGSAVHAVLESWMTEDDCDPAKLCVRAERFLADAASHPLMRALWQPRLMEAIAFIAGQVAANRTAGRRPLRAEAQGACEIAGVTLHGIADRIDVMDDGSLVIVDYKTGKPPSPKAVADGFSLQLGLLALIAEQGGISALEGQVSAFEYWSLARSKGQFGYVETPVGRRGGVSSDEFVEVSAGHFREAAALWLTGAEPFTAKLHPRYATYGDYDRLARLDEWYGRED
ncbi:MAG: double-strand break repair protein AddB [Sphingosinicella sp.]